MKTLIVVDMQKGFMISDNYISLVNKINSLIAKGDYDHIILTQYKNDINENTFYQDKIGWNKLIESDEQELLIEVPKSAKIVEKFGYGLQYKDLEYIKSLNLKKIDICGVKSEACVYAISLQLWDNGVYPNILINYVEGDNTNIMKEIYIKQFSGVDERI